MIKDMQYYLNRMDELFHLEKDWNSYVSEPTSHSAIDAATKFLKLLNASDIEIPMLFITPSPCGGIQIEWSVKDKELEVLFSRLGGVEYLQTWKIRDEKDKASLSARAANTVLDWLKL